MRLSIVQVIGNVDLGGAETHFLDLVTGLQAAGHHVRVICPRRGPLVERLAARNVPVELIEMVVPRPGDEYAFDPAVVDHLTTSFTQERPHVVHSHLYPAHLHASVAAMQSGVPAIVHTAHTIVVRAGEVLLGRLTPAHTVATARACEDLLRQAGVPANRLHVIYNGFDPAHLTIDRAAVERVRAELGLGRGPIIGTVARLSPEKGVDVLLRAVPSILARHAGLQLLLVGDGPEAESLHRLARQLGGGDAIHFLGNRDDVPAINRLLDVFVLPSRQEACSIALLEAMAAARPVVATRVGGSPELVRDGVDGLLVPPEDPAALADAVSGLLSHSAYRAALGAAGHERSTTHFTRDRTISAVVALYRDLLAGYL